MKKIMNSLMGAMVVAMMLIASGAGAQKITDCSQAVDLICTAFDNGATQFANCKSLQDLASVDMTSIVKGVENAEVPDSCNDYVLTDADKDNLVKSFNRMMDTMRNKMLEFAGGMVTADMLDEQFNPLKQMFGNVVNQSVTFGDCVTNLTNAF